MSVRISILGLVFLVSCGGPTPEEMRVEKSFGQDPSVEEFDISKIPPQDPNDLEADQINETEELRDYRLRN